MEKPILFSTPMVQAYMLDLKTQTRRTRGLDKVNINPDRWEFFKMEDCATGYFASFRHKLSGQTFRMAKSPYGRPGGVLWMRESWRPIYKDFRDMGSDELLDTVIDYYEYKADKQPHIQNLIKWKPSIHMPKVACRNRMTVIDLYPQRLQDISEEDASAEGVVRVDNYKTLVWEYETLWESINGKGSWEKNPWVWVIEFKRIQP